MEPSGTSSVSLDEDRAGLGQRLDHVDVVHDLVPDVDGRTVLFQRAFDGFDGPVHAGAVSARLGQQHSLAGDRLGQRSGRTGRHSYLAHVHGRRHANQGTFCRHWAANSRAQLGVVRRLRQA